MYRNNQVRDKFILFVLNPFVSTINSIKNIRDGGAYKFLYAWFLLFGISFCAVSEAADSFRYVEDFMLKHNYSWSQYIGEINDYFSFETNVKDIYTLTVNFFVGRFTENYHWTYFIYAAVFGFFYIKSLKIFIRNNAVCNNLVFYMLLFMFCYSNPIYNINGVRFWTAAWIGVYASLCIFVERDYWKLPLLFLLPLVHGSSVIWIAIILFAQLLCRFQKLTIGLYIASSFVSAVSFLDVLGDYSYLLPQFMQNQIWAYTESDMALTRMRGISEYGKAYADFLIALPDYFRILMSFLLILNRKKINQNHHAGYMLTVMLAMSAITNFLSGIPSMGRFQVMVIPMLVVVWSSNYDILRKYNKYFKLVPFFYAYSILYWFRRMTAISEIYLYLFPAPITAIKYLFL